MTSSNMATTPSSDMVLSIAPVSRGFGYAVYENLDVLVDWGIKEVRGVAERNEKCAKLVANLLALHRPATVALEDWRDVRSRRRGRIKTLLALIAANAEAEGIPVALYPRTEIKSVFEGQGAKNKHDIARVIARLMPELAPQLPKRRRTWESERYQMALFEAVALAITHLALTGNRALPAAA